MELSLSDLVTQTAPLEGSATSFLARRLRLAAGVTQAEAAKALGVNKHTVANWEHGRTAPSPRLRRRFRSYLATLAGGL